VTVYLVLDLLSGSTGSESPMTVQHAVGLPALVQLWPDLYFSVSFCCIDPRNGPLVGYGQTTGA
jgi:hypothetical protein